MFSSNVQLFLLPYGFIQIFRGHVNMLISPNLWAPILCTSTSERVTTVSNQHFPNGMLGANLHGSGNRVLSVNQAKKGIPHKKL